MKQSKIIFTLILFFVTIQLSSQTTTFEYILSTPFNDNFYDFVEIQDGSIYFTGGLSNVILPKRAKALVTRLDNSGILVDSILFTYPNKSTNANHIFQTQGGEFVLVASIYDTVNYIQNSGIVLYKMDGQLNLSDTTAYYFTPAYYLDAITANMSPDGYIQAGISLRISPSIPRSYFYIFNSEFDSIKAKYYADEARSIWHIHPLPNGYYWWLDLYRNRYEIADSVLNTLATQKVPDFINGNFGVKWDTDTSFYLSGAKSFPSSSANFSFIRQYHPIDTSGHLYNQWHVSDTIDFPAAWNGLGFQNKDTIFIGGTRNLDIHNPWYANQPSWFVLLQTDSMLNIRWERFYGGDAYYVMGKVLATHDGGCLIGGTRFDYLNATEQETDIIILKLNSEGLLVGTEENPVIEMHEALVFPNPGTNYLKVRIAAQYKHSTFELFDMNGKKVLTQQINGKWGEVNTTLLNTGTYIYNIYNSEGLFESGKWVKQ